MIDSAFDGVQMRFHSIHKWSISKEIEPLLFFAQRMDELLFDYTLDSYKPAALTSSTLCEEALGLIAEIEAGVVDASSLRYVLDELVWTLRHDLVAKRLLDVDVNQYVLEHVDTLLHEKKIRLEVLSKTLHGRRYLITCMDLLNDSIAKCRKSDIDQLARTLVATLIGMGVSKTFLYRKVKEYFFIGDSPQISVCGQIQEFFRSIVPVTHEFDVYFIVSNQLKQVTESIKVFNIEIISALPDNLATFAEQKGFSPAENETLVEVKDIRGYDCYSARGTAERRIDMLRDMFTLFFHRNELRWRHETLISQCCEANPMIVGASKSSMQMTFDPNERHASKQLNWMLENLAMRSGDSYWKFSRIVDLHGICVTNEVPENQLLNLWIAIETLVPSQAGKNKINNVVAEFDAFVRRTYIRRLIDRLLQDLMLWNAYVVRKLMKRVPDTKGKRMAIKLVHLLALESNTHLRTELYTELKDFHLLRFRVYSLAKALSSPQAIRRLIDSHAMRVEWQIRRIYRTRNLLVHAGTTPRYLGALIENGHDYLDMVLNEIMLHSCGPYQVNTLAQAFELQKLLVREYERRITATQILHSSNVDFLYQAVERA